MTQLLVRRSGNLVLLAALLAGAGCDAPPLPDEIFSEGAISADSTFPDEAGVIRGRVVWDGGLPDVPAFDVRANPLAPATFGRRQQRPNPNAPQIDPGTRGMARVLLFLRDKGKATETAWPHPPVRVEVRDDQFHVGRSDSGCHLGLVRRGDSVTFLSVQRGFHSVRARGAAFFSVALPELGNSFERGLDQPGIVELTSGAGRYWMRGYLFVADNPFCTLTERDGTFALHDVPPGEYDLVCWLPNWRVARQERDPESGVVSRLTFQPALGRVRWVRVTAGQTQEIQLELSPDDLDVR